MTRPSTQILEFAWRACSKRNQVSGTDRTSAPWWLQAGATLVELATAACEAGFAVTSEGRRLLIGIIPTDELASNDRVALEVNECGILFITTLVDDEDIRTDEVPAAEASDVLRVARILAYHLADIVADTVPQIR